MEPSRDNPRARANARKRAAQRRRRRQQAMLRMCVLLAIVLVVLVGSIILLLTANPLVSSLTVEVGSPITPQSFLKKGTDKELSFATELSELNLTVPGEHKIKIRVGEKEYSTTLVIVDTVAPKAEAKDTATKAGVVPAPESLLTNIREVGTVSITYQKEPDVSTGGESIAQVLLKDAAGNSTVVEVKVLVIADEIAPVIKGLKDRVYFVGDPIAYKENVVVTDDQTDYPVLSVDNSAVRPQTPGTYPVIYTATDAVGNKTEVTVYFTIKERPSGYVEPEVALDYAKPILDKITNENMTKAEVIVAIYNWVKTNIRWDNFSNKDNGWAAGACYGFTQKKGDCFTYFATTKALLEAAGIPNIDVTKVVTPETSASSHYWSLVDIGDGWYHMDCTPRAGNLTESFLLYTDEEMLSYSRKHQNCFNFDLDAYPDRATDSVQKYLTYSASTLKVTLKESW